MALRQIRIMGDEKLEKVCRPLKQVTDRDRELIQDMLDTMYDANGVGLAAPQVGDAQAHRGHRYRRRSDCYGKSGDSGDIRFSDRTGGLPKSSGTGWYRDPSKLREGTCT